MHHDGAPVYVYSFEYTVDPVNTGRAFHGLESNLIFGNNFGPPSNHILTTPDLVVYETMSTFWRRFADTGDPNPRGVPEQWPPYQTVDSAVDRSRAQPAFRLRESPRGRGRSAGCAMQLLGVVHLSVGARRGPGISPLGSAP